MEFVLQEVENERASVLNTSLQNIVFPEFSRFKEKALVGLGARQAEPEKSAHGESRRVKGKPRKEQRVSPSGGL